MTFLKYCLIYCIICYISMILLRLNDWVLNWEVVWFAPLTLPLLIFTYLVLFVAKIFGI
jgi:hypothetical protein